MLLPYFKDFKTPNSCVPNMQRSIHMFLPVCFEFLWFVCLYVMIVNKGQTCINKGSALINFSFSKLNLTSGFQSLFILCFSIIPWFWTLFFFFLMSLSFKTTTVSGTTVMAGNLFSVWSSVLWRICVVLIMFSSITNQWPLDNVATVARRAVHLIQYARTAFNTIKKGICSGINKLHIPHTYVVSRGMKMRAILNLYIPHSLQSTGRNQIYLAFENGFVLYSDPSCGLYCFACLQQVVLLSVSLSSLQIALSLVLWCFIDRLHFPTSLRWF